MPIRLQGKVESRVASTAVTLEDMTSALAGTLTLPAGNTGLISSQLFEFLTANLDGIFQNTAESEGTIGSVLGDWGGDIRGALQFVLAGPYNAQPANASGFLANDTYITNPSATYIITASTVPSGEIAWFDGGSFYVYQTCPSGSYEFSYKVLDFDGIGSESSARAVDVIVS